MTTPGYPDFQDYPNWIGANLCAGRHTSCPPGNTTLYQGPANNFASLYAHFQLDTGAGVLTFNWFLDQACTQFASSSPLEQIPVPDFEGLVPIRAPFLQWVFNNTSGVTANPITILEGTNLQPTAVGLRCPGTEIREHNVSVPATTTSTFVIPRMSSGDAFCSITPGDAGGHITYSLITQDHAGAQTSTIWAPGALTGYAALEFIAATDIIVLSAANADAAAHSFDAILTISGSS